MIHPKHPHLAHPKYRPDIDGLRAIAILSVVIFHTFPFLLPGGFIGVDIFFVISGYLISTIIFSSLELDRFSLAQFYIRRVRRIFPALILVLTTTLIFGWFILLPNEYEQLGKHTAASAGFIQNFILWRESGYFDNTAETKPLLHLWSLAVEEQFYIFWPLLLAFVWKRQGSFLKVTAVIAALSFTANIYLTHRSLNAAFFLPVSRFWELMIGGMLAYAVLHRPQLIDKHRNGQSSLGFLLIIAGLVFLNKESNFPGWGAILPTIGAFFLISAGPDAFLNKRMLANKAMVSIGLISYPIYLWHWVLLSYSRIIEGPNLSSKTIIITIILSVILAWLTYKFIERPIRFSKHTETLSGFMFLLMLTVGGGGYVIYQYDGLKLRSSVAEFLNQADDLLYRNHWEGWSLCNNEGEYGGCRLLSPAQEPRVAVIGDSHAGHLASGLADYYRQRNENIIIRLDAGCMPFYALKNDNQKLFTCANFAINNALNLAIESPSIKKIILSGYGNLKIHGRKPSSISSLSYIEGYTTSYSGQHVIENISAFREAMFSTLDRLVKSDKEIVFISDVPELYFNPLECITLRKIKLTHHKLRSPCSIDRKRFEERSHDYLNLISDAENAFPTVNFIHSDKYLCDDRKCEILINGRLIYSTRDHLTTFGSRYLINKIKHDLN